MAPASPSHVSRSASSLPWRPTKIMNMRDLSKDDDFLSHLLVEKLGTCMVPLLVHKMDSSRRLPKTDAQDLLNIVRRLVVAKGPIQHVIRQAVDDLLLLPSIRYYLKSYTQKQINAFATHASRYFELYHPSGSIEIAHTSRYSHRTGKSELCILATRSLTPGTVITELKGSMANLTDEEDKELKRTDLRNSDIRRDFSVIHSKQMKKNHLFLGPARFVNHDCDNNCELFREGKYITFRVLKPIALGEEITAHYGDGYFGKKNRHCLCETCEKNGRGGYAPEIFEDELVPSDSSSDSDSDSETSSSDSDSDTNVKPAVNLNERRTRRGVYAIVTKDDDSDESEDEEDNKVPLADAKDIPADGEIELTTEVDTASELTSLAPSISSGEVSTPDKSAKSSVAPTCDSGLVSRSSSSLTPLSSSTDPPSTPKSTHSSPFRSAISTRRQQAGTTEPSITQTATRPGKRTSPSSDETASANRNTSSPSKPMTRSVSSVLLSVKDKGKGKEKALSATPTAIRQRVMGKDDVRVKKEEVETRVLRMRPSTANVSEAAKVPAPKPSSPRGPDGIPLPTCSTCRNVLPVISVDSKIVWGMNFDGSKRKKTQRVECPRCLRHSAIYGQTWPSRVPPQGSTTTFLPTPREETTPVDTPPNRRVTDKVLAVLDRKLAAAISASNKHKKRDHDGKSKDEQPAKKRKIDQSTPPVTKSVVPSIQQQSASESQEPIMKRKRGRPRLSSPRRLIKVKAEDGVARPIIAQPRNTNGRFGKKDKVFKRELAAAAALAAAAQGTEISIISPRAERAKEREKTRNGPDGNDGEVATRISPRNKRVMDGKGEVDEYRRKALRQESEDVQMLEPIQRVLPRPVSRFRGGRLVSNPNPLRYALHAWASPVMIDESSSEDEKAPVTPEDDQSPPVDVVRVEEAEDVIIPAPAPSRGPLMKPSPFMFAKRRWLTLCESPVVRVGTREDRSNGLGTDGRDILKVKKSSTNTTLHHQWPTTINGYASDGDVSPISDFPGARLSPMSDGYPSGLSSSEDEPAKSALQHMYPAFTAEASVQLKAIAVKSSALSGSTPHLIHAGWDSCSEMSDS